jgi:hypothetical protein
MSIKKYIKAFDDSLPIVAPIFSAFVGLLCLFGN